jgi:hypothetical protein
MAKVNQKPVSIHTHEGGKACHINDLASLRRSVLSTLLWEDGFYEDGQAIGARIKSLCSKVTPIQLSTLAVEAREDFKLRHVPLMLSRELVRHPALSAAGANRDMIGATIERIIQRADELCEFLALYWKEKKTPIAAQVKKGLARAFCKFDAYQLAKYNRDNAIKLRDVLFLTHAKPQDAAQEALWKQLIDGTIEAPDTWEVALSGGANKKDVFERLMREKKLPAMALIRNLRNMLQSGCDEKLIRESIRSMKVERILPYRFITAARFAPKLEDVLEEAMLKCLDGFEKLPGKTVLLVDVSGSMDWALSHHAGPGGRTGSEMTRMDAANGIAILAREICETVSVHSFSTNAVQVPPRRGFALRDAISQSQGHGGTYLGRALAQITEDYDRIIVFTDEQSADKVPAPRGKGYVVNIAAEKNGVGYGAWHHIDGFSEATLKYILEYERAFGY